MDTPDSLEMPSSPDKLFQAAVDYGIDGNQLEYSLTLTPLERLIQHDQALELILAVRRAGIRHYGFDPRLPQDSECP